MKIEKVNQTQNNQITGQNAEGSQSQPLSDSIFDEEKETTVEIEDQKTFSEKGRDAYIYLNNTFYKIGDRVNKVFTEISEDLKLDKIIHELELDKNVTAEPIENGFMVSSGFTQKTRTTDPEKQTELNNTLNIKKGKPKKVVPDEIIIQNDIKNINGFQTEKIEIEQKYSYKNTNGIENYSSIGFKKEIKDNETYISYKTGVGINSSSLLWQNDEKTSSLSMYNSLNSSLIYSDKFDSTGKFITNQFSFSNGISTSLSYKINPQFNISFSGNGSYTLSTQKDSYSFGSGLNLDIIPIKEETEFQLHFGANYSQSDYVNPENSNNLNQKIGLNAKLDFNKQFGMEAGYNIQTDKNNKNSFSFGVIIR